MGCTQKKQASPTVHQRRPSKVSPSTLGHQNLVQPAQGLEEREEEDKGMPIKTVLIHMSLQTLIFVTFVKWECPPRKWVGKVKFIRTTDSRKSGITRHWVLSLLLLMLLPIGKPELRTFSGWSILQVISRHWSMVKLYPPPYLTLQKTNPTAYL